MKNYLLFLACMLMTSALNSQMTDLPNQQPSQTWDVSDLSDPLLCNHKGKRNGHDRKGCRHSKHKIFGFATVAETHNMRLPNSQQVNFDLLSDALHCKLSRDGGLELGCGTYYLTYGINIQAEGGPDNIEAWLSYKTKHSNKHHRVPFSTTLADVRSGISTISLIGNLLFTLNQPSTIYLNYSNDGKSVLSIFPARTFAAPFSLCAIKLGTEKNGN